MLDELNFLSVKQKNNLQVLLFVYRVTNDSLPPYLKNCFQSSEGMAYKTRNIISEQLRLPLFRNSSTQRSLFFNGVLLRISTSREDQKLGQSLRYRDNYTTTGSSYSISSKTICFRYFLMCHVHYNAMVYL